MQPKELIKEWVKKFNEANIEELVELYSEDAINHQVVTDPY